MSSAIVQVLPDVHEAREPGLQLQVGGSDAEDQLRAAGQPRELCQPCYQVYKGQLQLLWWVFTGFLVFRLSHIH